MRIQDLDHQTVCVLGYGREGKSAVRIVAELAPHARITIADQHAIDQTGPGYPAITGPGYLEKLEDFDVIIKSPGINWAPTSPRPLLTSSTQLFFDSLPPGVHTIGITGTKGKSSTANLLHQLLRAHYPQVYLAGNIGEPMLDLLPTSAAGQIFVLELSSYQLQGLTTGPDVAILTSFSPDHLDFHGSLEAYFEAKSHITRYQKPSGVVFYNAASPDCRRLAEFSPGRHIPVDPETLPPALRRLIPPSFIEANVAAAYRVALHMGVTGPEAVAALRAATNLPHRQQPLGVRHHIAWIDDAAATTPAAAQAALTAFGDEVDTLIVGGLNRGYDFTALGKQIADSLISNIILFPETGGLVRAAIEAALPYIRKTYFETSSMSEAVEFAVRKTRAGKICLLSSGAPSYNLYKNFNERGEAFAQAVAALKK